MLEGMSLLMNPWDLVLVWIVVLLSPEEEALRKTATAYALAQIGEFAVWVKLPNGS